MSGEQHCPCRDRESTKATADDTRISQFNAESAARTADIRGPKERHKAAIWLRGDVANERAGLVEYTHKAVVAKQQEMHIFGYFLMKAWGTYWQGSYC